MIVRNIMTTRDKKGKIIHRSDYFGFKTTRVLYITNMSRAQCDEFYRLANEGLARMSGTSRSNLGWPGPLNGVVDP